MNFKELKDTAFDYLMKYLIACGIGFNVFLGGLIIWKIIL